LLRRARDESLDPKYRDMLRIACLPYTSPRLPSTLPCKPPHLMSDAELRETYAAEMEHQRQLARSRGARPLLTLVKSK
jgi:hypothetical protein